MSKILQIASSRRTWAWPYILFMAMFVVLPLILVGFYAFTDIEGHFTIRNFAKFFTHSEAIQTFLYSVMIAVFNTAICLLILALPVSAEMVGGWETVPAEAAALPAEAQAAFDKAMDGLVGANYTPVALLATQLVAGTNYCILCQITAVVPDAVPAWALVYIYADLQGNARITNIFELQAGQFAVPEQG